MSVKTETKNFGSCLSVDNVQPWGWQNWKTNILSFNIYALTLIYFWHQGEKCTIYITINRLTSSNPSINGVSGQSLSGNLWITLPLPIPLPAIEDEFNKKNY